MESAMESVCSIVPSLRVGGGGGSVVTNPEVYSEISRLLREENSGAGDNNLCRWMYDTFQSGVEELQLLVIRFVPIIAGLYLSRVAHRKPQAGFEAVLLALYAHETTSRAGQALSVTLPDLTTPSNPTVAVLSPALEPHGTVRSTRRARIVGVALELFFSKIPHMPLSSKIHFCEFCQIWAGQDGHMYTNFEQGADTVSLQPHETTNTESGGGRVPLPWELLRPVLRILGHCLLGTNNKDSQLFGAATHACRCLFARSIHDVDPLAILPIRSLLRLSNNSTQLHDPTELPFLPVISL